jgi:MoaA/NifB/PqqE/SkfB family radical SAM enzyme
MTSMVKHLHGGAVANGKTAVLIGVFLMFWCSLTCPGCGYTTASTLPSTYRTIHVPAVRNSIKEYDLQAPLTNALIRKFTTDGRLRVVDADRADLKLETDITGYSLAPLTIDDEDRVAQFSVSVEASARLVDARTGKELWSEKGIHGTSSFLARRLVPPVTTRGNTEFFASTARSFPTGNQGEATTEALADLSSQILYRTVERW